MTKKRDKKPTAAIPKQKTPRPWFDAALGCLLGMTLFLSGEQVERSGVFHLPCILWMLAMTALLVKRLFWGNNESERPPARFTAVDGIVWFVFLLVFVSIFDNAGNNGNDYGGGWRPSLNMLSAWLALLTAWFLFRQRLYDPTIVAAVLALVLAVTVSEALTGLYQQFVSHPAMLRQFEADPPGTMAMIDPSIRPDTPDWDRLVFRLKTAGPIGTYPLTNTLGGLLGTGLVLFLGLLLYRPTGDGEKHKTLRSLFLLLTIALVLLCFVLTKCRSAYVAVAFGILLLGVDFFRRRLVCSLDKRVLVTALILVVLLGAVGAFAGGKNVVAGAKRSLGFRLEYWEASLGMIRDNPLLGCGSGNFKQTYTKYKLPGASEEIADPHNFVVEIAATAGLPAMALFLAFFVLVPVRQLLQGMANPPPFLVSETDSRKQDSPPGADRWLFFGGLAGCWLAFALSFNSEAPMDFWAPILATLVFAVAGFVFLTPGREQTSLQNIPVLPVVVTVLVLSVHLLAAGGISVTNTAVVFWLLTALLVNRDPLVSDRKPSRFWRIVAITALVGAMAFVYSQSMVPILKARTLSLQAKEERNPLRKIELLKQAVAADTLSAAHWEELATQWFLVWHASPGNEQYQKKTLDAQFWAMSRLPRSAGLRYVFAERLAVMSAQTGDAELRDRALELYRQAIERYPNHAKYRAPYALFLGSVAENDEQRREARQQRDEALQLDDIMTHADQKLPEDLRQRLLDME